jgi:rhodanese-related sulfurtransferase
MEGTKNLFIFKITVILIIAMFLTGLIFLAGCSEVLAKKEPIQISVEKVAEILKTQKDSYIILDVRTREEFDSGHLDSALLIPVEELETRYVELSKNIPVIVYCRSGRRSATAAALLVSKGFSKVYDMTGGINAWTGKGYPVIIENAAVTSNTSSSSSSAAATTSDTGTSDESQGTENTTTATDTSVTEEVKYITADELYAKTKNNEDIIILDVRSEDSYMVKHIKGAVNIPYRDFEGRTGELDGSKEIIIYCSNNDCGLSANAVTLLAKSGFKNVSALKGGIESWQTKGYPVE